MTDRTHSPPPRRDASSIACSAMQRLIALPLSLAVGGCLTYTPQELSAMPPDRLCEMQLYSRVNLRDDAKASVQDELRKRNVDCSRYVAQLETERAQERERRMYELNGP